MNFENKHCDEDLKQKIRFRKTYVKTVPVFKNKSVKAILALCLSFCLLVIGAIGCAKRETIHIGVQNDNELKIMAEMASLLLQEQGYPSQIIEIDDGLQTLHSAVLGGNIDMYPGFTGEGWSDILNQKETYRKTRLSELKKQYEKMNMQWVGVLPAYSLYTLAVRKETADKYNLKDLSDLAKVSKNLTLGSSLTDLERQDSIHLLEEIYDMDFKTTKVMESDQFIEALKNQSVDVIPIRSNDGRIKNSDFVTLIDDRMALPESSPGFVLNDQLLEDDPQLESALERISSMISANDLSEMNRRTKQEKEDPRPVAREFLQSKGMLP